ncbi:FadR family transcriptional regulator [Ornithinimicrobium ciconiae]|uniref:FadR family transcriptional regulator n=1 Tax=Ornithinimicrobium ciconiae TaxID=2594265 RepID=A0A516G9C0_9MICO|nr:FCD domain-containing protein [Ornithinimicrobium ciconiae]QDO88118.1 FadR family transcriptional regulator [Ornithinimicrobium ciconiae]
MSLLVDVPRSLAAEVAERLSARCAEVPANTRLGTKKELQVETGVAAATLNEALRMLQSQGLLTLKTGPNGGVFTAEPDPLVSIGQALVRVRGSSQVAEVLPLRDALDPLTVREAARHRTAADLRMLKGKMTHMKDVLEDDLEFAKAVWDFHRGICSVGRNEILKSVSLGLLEIIVRSTDAVVGKTMEQKLQRIALHQALYDAIESQDPEECDRASHAHHVEGG